MYLIHTFKRKELADFGLPDSVKTLGMAVTFNRQRRTREVVFNVPNISLEIGSSLVDTYQKQNADKPLEYETKPVWLTRKNRRNLTIHKEI